MITCVYYLAGAWIHQMDPLPQEPNMLWCVFIIGGVSTPIMFPVISACVLYPHMSNLKKSLCAIWLFLTYSFHVTLLYLRMDLSFGHELPRIDVPGGQLDGSSQGGAPYGIKTDLLTSAPSARSAALFVHAMFFIGDLVINCAVCLPALWDPPVAVMGLLPSVQRLTVSVFSLLVCVSLLPILMLNIGVSRTLDFFHISGFIIVYLGYTSLRVLVNEPQDKKTR